MKLIYKFENKYKFYNLFIKGSLIVWVDKNESN
jgi:hypothetical protein